MNNEALPFRFPASLDDLANAGLCPHCLDTPSSIQRRTETETVALHVAAIKANAAAFQNDAVTYETFCRRADELWSEVPPVLRERVAEAISA